MSAPIRAADGCIIGSKYNRHDTPPFWIRFGATVELGLKQCERHTRRRWETELLSPRGRVVGILTKQEMGSTYIEVIHHRYRNFFFGKDIFCREHNEWHHWGYWA